MPDHGRAAPPPATMSEQLLLQALNQLSAIDQRLVRTETQNESILAAQADAVQRDAAATESRGKMHDRINEISLNVAHLESDVGSIKLLEPIVTMLKDAHVERATVRRVIQRFCKNGYVIGGGVVTAGVSVWHQWETLRGFVLRILGAKVGGP